MKDLLVWWLTQADYKGFNPTPVGRNPLKIPDYAWEGFKSRHGRGGRGRIWNHSSLGPFNIPVPEDNPLWFEIVQTDAGGILIKKEDALACAAWGGSFTDLNLKDYYPILPKKEE